MSLTQARLVIAAIIVLLIAILGILFKKDIQKLFTRETQSTKIANKQSLVSPPEQIKEDIATHSFISGYQLSLYNKEQLISWLKKVNIINREHLYINGQTTGQYPLRHIDAVIRADQKKGDFSYSQDAIVYLGQGRVQINFVLSEQQLSDPKTADLILKNFIGTMYLLRYPQVQLSEAEKFIEKTYDELTKDDLKYFVIESK